MLACLLDSQNKIALRDVPLPRLEDEDVLVKMEACGICGTDLEKLDGRLGPGGILGHEVSGTVERAPKHSKHAIGDRVVAHHHVPCYKCTTCLQGDLTLCQEFKKTNLDPCGLAAFFKVPKYNVNRGGLIQLPDRLSFEEGALVEPTACCIRAIRRANPQKNDNVLVVGLGPTGLTQVQLLQDWTRGKIFGSDVLESRLEMGARLGASETLNPSTEDVPQAVKNATGEGADLAFVATGNEKALDQAFSSLRRGGKILLFGAPGIGAQYRLDVSSLFTRQISLMSSYSCVEPEMHEAIRLILERRINVRGLISDRFRLEKADRALDQARTSRTSVKTVITA